MLSRRDFFRLAGAASAAGLAGAATRSPAQAATPAGGGGPVPAAKPNILLICADDHGQWALGAHGNRDIATPNLDWLARTGLHLTAAATPCPVCSPARASLFTGLLPSQHGVHDVIVETLHPDLDRLAGLPVLPELLQSQGYRTGLVGKWHATADSLRPYRGFDRWLSYDGRSRGWMNQYDHFGPVDFSDQGRTITREGFQAAFLTEEAERFIRGTPVDRPFFLFAGYVEPHSPFAGLPARWASAYRGGAFSSVPRGEKPSLPPSQAGKWPENPDEALAQYYAAVSYLDEQVGRLIDVLEATGRLANTLVVYTSDHGHMCGHHGLWGKGKSTLPQNFYEESIRVPCFLRGPGIAPEKCNLAFDHLDLFATLTAAAGAPLDAARRHPGRNVLGPRTGWRTHQFCEYGNARLVADGRYKLVLRSGAHAARWPGELHDLEADPRETRNLFADPAHAGTVRALGAELRRHFDAYADPSRSGDRLLDLPPCNPTEPWRAKV